MSTVIDLVSRVSIADVWQALGGDPPRHGRARAFWRGGDGLSVSLNVEKGAWYDFRDSEGGGVLALVQHINGGSRQDALKWLAERFGLPLQDCSDLSIQDRIAWAERRSAAEQEAAALVSWKSDLLEVLREQRRGLVTVYHTARRYLQTHPFEHYEATGDVRYDAAWEVLYTYEPKIADLDARIDLLTNASYEALLPLFREARAKSSTASCHQLVKQ